MGFEPTIRYNPYNDLANRRLQPLGHPSARDVKKPSKDSRLTYNRKNDHATHFIRGAGQKPRNEGKVLDKGKVIDSNRAGNIGNFC